MEITQQTTGDWTEVAVKGRLDGYWADHLTKALDRVVRAGSHRIRLNLAHTTYISSIGIRVLVQFYQQLGAIHGKFVVTQPSEPVKRVLDMARLGEILMPEQPAGPQTVVEMGRLLDRPEAHWEVLAVEREGSFRCRVVGDPGLLEGCRFEAGHSRTMQFPTATVAVGLGAFGHTYEECQSRFGEFLAVAGAAAYQPTDGSNVADYLIAEGNFVPELQVLYGLAGEGAFAHLARFEARPESGPIPLRRVADAALEIASAPSAAVVLVAETSGLLGAALRQSPAQAPAEGAPFRHPEIRRWLSYTPERVFPHSLAVAAGIVSCEPAAELAPLLRPLAPGAPGAHFHAVAFSYRPLKKGRLDLAATVRSLFEAQTLQGVLHLLGDDREAGRESEFVRGACWISPLVEVTR
jgi:anti-anti-sigma factor